MEYLSSGFSKITGFPADYFIGNRKLSYGDIIHSDDRMKVWGEIQESINKSTPFELKYRIINKNGDIRWVWERGQGILNKENEVEAIEGFITDITELTNKDLQLRQVQ